MTRDRVDYPHLSCLSPDGAEAPHPAKKPWRPPIVIEATAPDATQKIFRTEEGPPFTSHFAGDTSGPS